MLTEGGTVVAVGLEDEAPCGQDQVPSDDEELLRRRPGDPHGLPRLQGFLVRSQINGVVPKAVEISAVVQTGHPRSFELSPCSAHFLLPTGSVSQSMSCGSGRRRAGRHTWWVTSGTAPRRPFTTR